MEKIKRRKIHQPELFQGNLKKTNYFEGWYFKQVVSTPNQTISFIPGISLNNEDKHAFIQVIISPSMETHYFRFEIDDFHAKESTFEVRIGDNIFNSEGIKINLNNQQKSIVGELRFSDMQPIKQSRWMPNIMGPFGYLRFMECNHGVISMNHEVSGALQVNTTQLIFNQSKGYLEKDWGKSFPKTYCWLQCNDFDVDDVSFMFSRAAIPFLGLTFQGFICNLVHAQKEYRLATYTGAKIKKFETKNNQLKIVIKSSTYQLEIIAESKAYGELKAPNTGVMDHVIKEGIEGKVTLLLTTRNGECLIQTKGQHAGIEIETVPSV